MLSQFRQPIWVGLNPDAGPKQAQGLVWVEKKEEDLQRPYLKSIPMIIRPASATRNGLSMFHYRGIIAQLRKMGVNPKSIEIYGKDYTYTYSGTQYEELCVHDRSGPPEKALTNEMA